MAYVFPDSGIGILPTGALALAFKATDGWHVPTVITVQVIRTTDSVVYDFADLESVVGGDDWNYITRTPPLPLGGEYYVDVSFDGAIIYTSTIDIPSPGRRRSPVLRQRIYEVLFDGYLDNKLASMPYGTIHVPQSVQMDFKPSSAIIVEVQPCYLSSAGYYSSDAQVNDITVPINFYMSIDDAEDTEDLIVAAEDVYGYLIETDWELSAFAVFQSTLSISGGTPDIDQDRKLASIKSTMTVPMRRRF